MNRSSIVAPDGTQIVYDVVGEGPAILLLHGGGGGQSRQSWHEVGYVARLKNEFKVITMDIRGHGDSDKPTNPAAYAIKTMCDDILLVADACDVQTFTLWGFSYGGHIGRYLAAQSDCVEKIIIMGIPFGHAASGDFRQFIMDFRAHWQPILQAQRAGSFDPATLSEEDQDVMANMDVPVTLAWLTAMLDWGLNEPNDLRCPVLWLSGSENELGTVASMKAYEEKTAVPPNVQMQVIDGLNHPQEFEEINRVFPTMLAFTKS
jgi:pimeloyl-ACP methyl ester carboxylesterase